MTIPASLLYVRITGDQTMRPLGITIANLAGNLVNGSSRGVVVQINWGTDARSASSKSQVKIALQKALSIHQVEYRVKISPVAGREITVYYLVGNSRIGPYRLSNMSGGIPAAMSAYRAAASNN